MTQCRSQRGCVVTRLAVPEVAGTSRLQYLAPWWLVDPGGQHFPETEPNTKTPGKTAQFLLLNVSSGLGHHWREVLMASAGLQVLMEMTVCFSFQKKRVYDHGRLWD